MAAAHTGNSKVDDFAAEAAKVAAGNDKLKTAVLTSGDNFQKGLLSFLSGMNSKKEADDLKRELDASLAWYKTTMTHARERTREVSRIDLKQFEDDVMQMEEAQMELDNIQERLKRKRARINAMHVKEANAETNYHDRDTKRAENKVAIAMIKDDRVAEAENLQVLTSTLKSYDEDRKRAWKTMLELLNCTEKDLDMDRSNACTMKLARFSFLMVILGCELDMWGYFLAFVTYWKPELMMSGEVCKDNPSECSCSWVIIGCPFATLNLMHCLLLIGPIGYLTAIIYYFGVTERKQSSPNEPLLSTKHDDPEQGLCKYRELRQVAQKQQVDIEYYHIVPILRCYLLIKEMVPDDVEALFRVNGLSTFTLGFAQIACMILGWSHDWFPWPPTAVLKVGMFAQGVNIFMTFLYFATAVPVMMQTSNTIDAVISREREKLQADLIKYNEAVQDAALKGNKEDKLSDQGRPETLQLLHDKAEREIKEVASLKDLDLTPFSMEEKIRILFYQRSKKINEFVAMCKLGTPQ